MLKKQIAVIFAFVVVVLFASCAKEGPTGPTGVAGPSFTGSISVHLSLYDQYGSPVLINLYKAQLVIASLNSPADPYISDTAVYTDAFGSHVYTNTITTGAYSLAATDSGYGSTALSSFQYVSGTLYKDIAMSAIPTFVIDTLIANKKSDSTSDSLVIGVPADTRARNCIVFVGAAATVANTVANYLLVYVVPVGAGVTNVPLTIPAQDLHNAGINKGATAYYAAYSYVVNDASVYEDLVTGKKVYNAVGAVKTAAAIAP